MKRLTFAAPLQRLAVFGLFALGALALPVAAHASVTVKSGDTLSKLFPTNWQQICSINGIANCDLIFPNQVLLEAHEAGQAPVVNPVQPQPVVQSAPVQPAPKKQAPATIQRPSSANTYGVGWCTWYVKNRRPDIHNGWGNAGYNWVTAAQRAGFATGATARAGAIGVMTGHVVYIESVSGNMVNLSEMGYNYVPGKVTYRTVPASGFTYIY